MLQLSQSSKHHLKLLLPCSFFFLRAAHQPGKELWSRDISCQPPVLLQCTSGRSNPACLCTRSFTRHVNNEAETVLFDIEDCGHDARDYLRGFAQTRAQVTNGLLWPRSRDPRSSGVKERKRESPIIFTGLCLIYPKLSEFYPFLSTWMAFIESSMQQKVYLILE